MWNWDSLIVSSSPNSFLVQIWFQITFTKCLLSEECSFEVLVLVFCIVFLCVVAKSLWLSQASWVLTIFKTQHKPCFLRDTSQTSLPFVQTRSIMSFSRLCMYSSLSMCVLAELLNYVPYLPLWLPFLLNGELLQVRISFLLISVHHPGHGPKNTLGDQQCCMMVKNTDFRLQGIVSNLNSAT